MCDIAWAIGNGSWRRRLQLHCHAFEPCLSMSLSNTLRQLCARWTPESKEWMKLEIKTRFQLNIATNCRCYYRLQSKVKPDMIKVYIITSLRCWTASLISSQGGPAIWFSIPGKASSNFPRSAVLWVLRVAASILGANLQPKIWNKNILHSLEQCMSIAQTN